MENLNSNIPVTSGVARPWQGTMLGVLSIIGAVFLGIVVIFSLIAIIGGTAILSQIQSGSTLAIGGLIGTLGALIIVPFILLFVLQVFITRGLFKGQKWSVILLLIFSIFGILDALTSKAIITILINVFIIYAEYVCLKHPFYAAK